MPGLGDALLGPDDVHDALAGIAGTEERDAVRARVARERLDHRLHGSGSAMPAARPRVGT